MENVIYLIIVAIVVCGIAVSIWNNRPTDTKTEKGGASSSSSAASENDDARKLPMAFDLLLEALGKIGCQWQVEDGREGWKRVYFAYQGEHFFAEASNDTVYVHLWDTFWKYVDLEDIDEVARLRKAINTANVQAPVTTVFSIDNEESKMITHCKATLPLMPSMLYRDEYLKSELDGFFDAHRVVETEMMKLREKENGGNL